MSSKDTLVNLGLLAAGGVAIAAASGAYGKGSAAKVDAARARWLTKKRDVRWLAKKYGVSEAELLVYEGKTLKSVDRAVEAWREQTGFPAPNSSISRGYFLDLLKEKAGKGSAAKVSAGAAYRIVSKAERDFDTDAPLYWSNSQGWVGKRSASRFSGDEKARMHLPMGGAWESISSKGSRATRGMRYTLAYGGDNDSTIHVSGVYAPYSKAVASAKAVAKRVGRTVEVSEKGYDLVAFVEPDGRVDDGGYGKKGSRAEIDRKGRTWPPQIGDGVFYAGKVWMVTGIDGYGPVSKGYTPELFEIRRTIVVDSDRRYLDKVETKRKVPLSQIFPLEGSHNVDSLATLAHFNPEVVTDADLSGDPCITGSLARQSDSVMRALTTTPGTPIPGPSAKKLDDAFNLGAEEAKSLKWFMQAGRARAALDYANKLLDGFGIEYLRSSEDGLTSFTGIDYINLGDTYTLTLLYDRKKRRFFVGTWGDEVERQPRRFAD